ncbi:AIR synthase family protein [Halosolutus gelatinilyticus]|uniref:AIR synthase family protein n=1 Tax=Halosolutus gelatinilyticus TaxID=2931975 RepID=UPI001FF5890F|nr:AIR synthase family protein [Halosolutus gelatinilyticus]
MPGKVGPDELLAHVFDRTGTAAADETVVQGAAYGEDAAAIDWPGADTLVVSSDPISLAAADVGTLGVAIACNDVAASGADPRWLTVVALLPDEDAPLEAITSDLHAAARDVGAAIVGGHTEYVDQLDRPLLSLTAMGATDAFLPTGGAEPGDRVVLTKAAGVEGTAILAADFGDDLGVDPEIRERAQAFLEELSVVPDARIVREYATAMHDPTEGGVAAGLLELARASAVRIEVERDAVPVRDETAALCDAAGVDPLRIFGSGALLATVPQADVSDVLDALSDAEIDAADIGRVEPAGVDDEGDGSGESEESGAADEDEARESAAGLVLGRELLTDAIEDDLYPLWEAADAAD